MLTGTVSFNGAANKTLAESHGPAGAVVQQPGFNGAANKTLAEFSRVWSRLIIAPCFNGAANKTLAESLGFTMNRGRMWQLQWGRKQNACGILSAG